MWLAGFLWFDLSSDKSKSNERTHGFQICAVMLSVNVILKLLTINAHIFPELNVTHTHKQLVILLGMNCTTDTHMG